MSDFETNDARKLIHEADPTLACRMQWEFEGPGRHTQACDRLTAVIRNERAKATNAWGEVYTARARLRDGDAKNALARLEMVTPEGDLAASLPISQPSEPTAAFFTSHNGPTCPECGSFMIPHVAEVGLKCVNCGVTRKDPP